VIVSARTPFALVPLAQHAAQALADPSVQWSKRRPMAVLEISIPAPERAIEVLDNIRHSAGPLSRRLLSDGVLELLEALLAWPAIAPLKVIPQKVKASRFRGVDNARLGGVQGQPCFLHPLAHLFQRLFRFLPT